MRKTALKRLVFAVLILSSTVAVNSQTRRQAKPEYRILSVGNMNAISADGCEGLKFVRVLVSKRASKESLERNSRTIASSYRKEIDLMVFFFTNRGDAREFFDAGSDDEEERRSRAVRGIYSRAKSGSVEKVMFFPSGLTDDALAEFEPQEDN